MSMESSSRPWLLVIIVIVLAGLIGFYLGNKKEVEAPLENTIEETEETELPVQNSTTTSMPAQGEFGDEVEVVKPKIEQPVTVIGRYSYSEDPESSVAGKVCFTPSTISSIKRFCFDNGDEAFAIFGIQQGFSNGTSECTVSAPATIEIKGYARVTSDLGGYDKATLTKVVSVGSESYAACK
jgi:hypothetical protein